MCFPCVVLHTLICVTISSVCAIFNGIFKCFKYCFMDRQCKADDSENLIGIV